MAAESLRETSTGTPILEQVIDIETPEQVAFSYTVAGIGSRGAAVLIDTLILAMLLIAIALLYATVLAPAADRGPRHGSLSSSWAAAIIALLIFAVNWGYFVVFEALWDGQTPGKRRMGIRVVQDGGYSVGFAASAVRNLVRLIDMLPPPLYGVGIISVTLSKTGKRLGDLVAGTFVVQERLVQLAPAVVAARPTTESVTARLSDDEYELLERFRARRDSLDPPQRARLAQQVAARLEHYLPDDGRSQLAQLSALFETERAARARGLAARGATGAAREQHAIVALGAKRWSAFARTLADARARGLRSLTPDEVSLFVAGYREVASDLARLKTAAHGRDSDAQFYLSRLVGAAHNLLYRQRPLSLRSIWLFLSVRVPREIRRSAGAILFAAALLFGPMVATFVVVEKNPALADDLAPGIVERANRGAAAGRRDSREYVTVSELERPVMASAIISNNVQVVYTVFASGVTAGVLTVLQLVFNGVSIGAALGLYANKGILHQIGEFVIAHSVFELSAICFAGGGAFLIAAAILLPGARTRREALVINGRRAIRLIAAATLMLLVAGSIEGLISPRTDIPISAKVTVAALSLVTLVAWIMRGRGRAPPADEPVEEESAYSDELGHRGDALSPSAPVAASPSTATIAP